MYIWNNTQTNINIITNSQFLVVIIIMLVQLCLTVAREHVTKPLYTTRTRAGALFRSLSHLPTWNVNKTPPSSWINYHSTGIQLYSPAILRHFYISIFAHCCISPLIVLCTRLNYLQNREHTSWVFAILAVAFVLELAQSQPSSTFTYLLPFLQRILHCFGSE